MLRKNAERIVAQLSDSDRVLDVGGWYEPFHRADWVVDILPYETHGIAGHTGPDVPRYTKDTWIIHDVNSREPLPFADKEFDFVTCAHVLEDIRDPIGLCSELSRVAKRGYIEVPSRLVEQTMDLEGRGYAGYYHHRWLVDIEGSSITFRFKAHLLHGHWPCHFPRSFADGLGADDWVSWFDWEDAIDAREVIQVSQIEVRRELARFVERHYWYPRIYHWLDGDWPGPQPRIRLRQLVKKLVQKIPGCSSVGRVPPERDGFWEGFYEIESRAREKPSRLPEPEPVPSRKG
jgi:hypothetical protein